MMLPDLLGPHNCRSIPGRDSPKHDAQGNGVTRSTGDATTLYPRFDWVFTNGEWQRDESAYVELPVPVPVPDYSPVELALMEAAEAKRRKRENRY